MTTLISIRQAISDVKSGFKEVHADSRLWNKFVYSILGKHLKTVLSRDSDAFRLGKRESLYQTLKCVDVIEAPLIDPCCGLRTRCTVFRTKERLPDMVEDSMGPKIRLVAAIDGKIKPKGTDNSFEVISPMAWLKKLDNPWMKWDKSNYALYSDGYLYFPGTNWKLVLVEALFLMDISEFNTCEDNPPCVRFLDKKIYATEREVAEAVGLTIQELAGIFERKPDQIIIDKNPNTP